MTYIIPQGAIIHTFMTDQNGFTSEAQVVLGSEMTFEETDRVTLSDLVEASNSIRLIPLHSKYLMFSNAELGTMVLAVPSDAVEET